MRRRGMFTRSMRRAYKLRGPKSSLSTIILIVLLLVLVTTFYHRSLEPIQVIKLPQNNIKNEHPRLLNAKEIPKEPVSKNVCPNYWTAYTPPAHTNEQCVVVNSHSKEFEISICAEPGNCRHGFFKVTRINQEVCMRMERRRAPIVNQKDSDYVKKKVGPDTFHLVMKGPQKVSSPKVRYLGYCSYAYDFELHNGGFFTAELFRLYSDYDAIDSLEDKWPSLYSESLLDSGLEFSLCTQCKRYISPPQISQFASYPLVKSSEKLIELRKNNLIDICPRDNVTNGSWIMANEVDMADPIKNFANYSWIPVGCIYSNSFDETTMDSRDCLINNPHKILFIGDEHARDVYESIIQRVWNTVTEKFDMSSNSHFLEDHSITTGNTNWNWILDPGLKGYFKHKKCEKFLDVDKIVFNVGHEYAKGIIGESGGQLSNEAFAKVITTVVKRLKIELNSCRSHERPLDLIYLGITAFPFSDERKYIRNRDWRTLERLREWDMISKDIVMQNGIRVVNSFEITLPMIDVALQDGRYKGTDAMRAMTDVSKKKTFFANNF